MVGDRSDPEDWGTGFVLAVAEGGSIGGRQRSVKRKSKSVVGIGVGATTVYYLAMFCFPRQK
jgi:hypothetical protein